MKIGDIKIFDRKSREQFQPIARPLIWIDFQTLNVNISEGGLINNDIKVPRTLGTRIREFV